MSLEGTVAVAADDLRAELERLYRQPEPRLRMVLDVAVEVGRRWNMRAMDERGELTDFGRRAYIEWVRISGGDP